jgi:capsular polysaccharide export protein
VALPQANGRRRILVPGQVADDLSVQLGNAGIPGNEALLARVRSANPDALVIYKPHPDVDAGHRAGAIPDAMARRYADCVVRGVPMASLIAAVDEVHTLTSLAGYEALLRGRRVVAYGQPFYAGWGLTEDMAPIPRRDRRLSLEELSAGVLLLYPRYLDPVTELPCPPEVLLDRMANRTIWRPTGLMRLRQWQGRARVRLAGLHWPAWRSMSGSGP